MNFNKMTRYGSSLNINSKVPFYGTLYVDDEFIMKTFEFAYSMTFGKSGEHRHYRSGGIHQRRNGEIFCDTFQGKLSEYAIYQSFSDRFQLAEPDTSCYDLGKWDSFDFNINGKVISVKSTKHFGNLLLLETKDWNDYAEYIPNGNERVDYTILVRIKDEVTSILKQNKLYYSDYINKNDLWNLLSEISGAYDIPGYIKREDLMYIIQNNFVIRQGEMLNGNTRMDADNYYCQTGDLRDLETFFIDD